MNANENNCNNQSETFNEHDNLLKAAQKPEPVDWDEMNRRRHIDFDYNQRKHTEGMKRVLFY